MLTAFRPYVAELEQALLGSSTARLDLERHLDGEAGRQLRSLVPLEELRRIGAFFTGERLARHVARSVPTTTTRYVDPACGCGDLLLAASAHLPVQVSLEATLEDWNDRLVGRDLVPEFVSAARVRLAIAALARGARADHTKASDPSSLLTNIATGDGLSLAVERGEGVLLNPPYGAVLAPATCRWSSGKTTEAALFLDRILERCEPGSHIAAVLPDVLRGGSRYRRFRAAVETRLSVREIEPVGLFDALTDVHVFILSGSVGPTRQLRSDDASWVPRTTGPRLSDVCTVSVGTVVANRDPHCGPARLYVDARSRGRDRVVRPTIRRQFSKRVVDPPFVVIPRTSRPEEREQTGLRATIVQADEPVAVENHLLVLVPTDHTVRGCKELVRLVESREAVSFLNEQLRCRHLTVGAVKAIPR